MSENRIAKIAVSAANYSLDKPYDYLIPASMADSVGPGMRVTVPFSRGNRRSEGIVLGLADRSECEKLKPVESCLDKEPMLTRAQLKLALWMHDRLFCTVYAVSYTHLDVYKRQDRAYRYGARFKRKGCGCRNAVKGACRTYADASGFYDGDDKGGAHPRTAKGH